VTGAVYDRGYRPYEGEHGGRTAARRALYRATLRRALGLRRSWRQKVAPFVLLAIAVVPAVVNVGVKYLTRNTPANDIEFFTYREYVGVSNALLVFVGLTAPDIMCPDRRQRVLPLIFARPLTGFDYVLAKVGAMASILFAFAFIPQVVLFVGQMLVSEDGALRYLRDNAEILWQVPVAVALLALYYSVVGVAIASMTSRRIIAGATFVGLLLVSSIISGVLVGEDPASESAAALINLAGLPLVVRDLVFLGEVGGDHGLSGVTNGGLFAVGAFAAVVVTSLVALGIRYDEVER
jgi:ABC-2 type transport system permease protein